MGYGYLGEFVDDVDWTRRGIGDPFVEVLDAEDVIGYGGDFGESGAVAGIQCVDFEEHFEPIFVFMGCWREEKFSEQHFLPAVFFIVVPIAEIEFDVPQRAGSFSAGPFFRRFF